MPNMFDYAVSRYADRVLVKDGISSLTYQDANHFTHRFTNAMSSVGARRGDRAAILSINHNYAFLVPLGCARAGIVSLGINSLSSAEEVRSLLENNAINWLFFHSNFLEIVTECRKKIPAIKGAFCLDDCYDGLPMISDWVYGFPSASTVSANDPDDIVIMYTSGGTTGTPKGVLTSSRGLSTMVASFLTVMPCEAPPVHLAAVPISHGAGGLARSFLCQGITNILLPSADPEEIMRTIEAERVTMLFLPPTVIYRMLSHPNVRKYDYSSLKYFLYAAAPMSPHKLKEAVDIFGPVMCQSYGQAEAPIICTYLSPEEHMRAIQGNREQRLQSCGRPTPYTQVEVMSDDGELLRAGETGEIVIKGDIVMQGYYNNPDANKLAGEFGWHHTGDVGYKDEEGYVYIIDRKKDMIISGGLNIYPAEIEKTLLSHAAIQDCAVVGVPDDHWGEAVKAVIELQDNAEFKEEEMIAFVKQKIGSVKTPKSIEVWPELPRNRLGKVLRREVRDSFWQGKERQV